MITTITVNVSGIVLIGLVVWWFLIKKPKATSMQNDSIEIKVRDGVYDPPVIQATKGEQLHLRFLREDTSPCSEVVVFHGLDVSAELPVGTVHEITLTIDEPGEYEFTCQMGMYRGKLIVA